MLRTAKTPVPKLIVGITVFVPLTVPLILENTDCSPKKVCELLGVGFESSWKVTLRPPVSLKSKVAALAGTDTEAESIAADVNKILNFMIYSFYSIPL